MDVKLQIESRKATIGLVAMNSKGVLPYAHESPIQAFAIRKLMKNVIQYDWKKNLCPF